MAEGGEVEEEVGVGEGGEEDGVEDEDGVEEGCVEAGCCVSVFAFCLSAVPFSHAYIPQLFSHKHLVLCCFLAYGLQLFSCACDLSHASALQPFSHA